jgi:hypothetical protein
LIPNPCWRRLFGHHDFLGQHKGQEVSIQTTESIVEDGAV